jgi:hypothetical protein
MLEVFGLLANVSAGMFNFNRRRRGPRDPPCLWRSCGLCVAINGVYASQLRSRIIANALRSHPPFGRVEGETRAFGEGETSNGGHPRKLAFAHL